MVKLIVDANKCNLCMECVDICPAVALRCDSDIIEYYAKECTYCETCMDVCEQEAITIKGE